MDLMQVYRQAQAYDAAFATARANLEAGRERGPQGLAGLLPSLSLSGNTTWNDNEVENNGVKTDRRYNSNAYTLTLSQPVFRWQNWAAYDQGKLGVALAEAQFVQARQDLILRVAQAYFDVLTAQVNLRAAQSQKVAIAQQLEQAKRNFEVGTATIVDTYEAQSRYDLAWAQEIASENDLEVRREALRVLIGEVPAHLASLDAAKPILPPSRPSWRPGWRPPRRTIRRSRFSRRTARLPPRKSSGSGPGTIRPSMWWPTWAATTMPRTSAGWEISTRTTSVCN